MPNAYHIKQWDDLYESNSSRTVQTLTYYCKPNKFVGECLGYMLSQPDGLELYAVWTFLEALASTAPKQWRGWLIRNGSPMDAARIANLTRIPIEKIQRTLDFCTTAPMDWLEVLEWPDGAPTGHRRQADGAPTGHRKANYGISAGLSTDQMKTEDSVQKEREKKGEELDPKEARSRQTTQFAALTAQLRKLEATPAEDRDDAEEAEIKKTRRLLNQIQKKQGAGDFTPVQEKTK
jgi:hypothetical protein